MITLRTITEDNFDECVKLDVEDNQQSFVANNTYSLAQAWLYPDTAKPLAIYYGEEMVGFAMLDTNYKDGKANGICDLWRLMIDRKHQGKGFGKAAMQAVLHYAREELHAREMRTAFVPGNTVAEKLYKGCGFVPNGELDGDEIVLMLDLGAR